MPISHELKCLFVHIPKTAGTSIEAALGMHGAQDDVGVRPIAGTREDPDRLFGGHLQHLTFREIQDRLPADRIEEYFKFTVVRNPWDRLVSEYAWISRGDGRAWARGPVGTFEEFVRSRDYERVHRHGLSQVAFLVGRDGHVGPDEVYRYEGLQDAWTEIRGRLRIDVPLPRRMSANHADYRELYTPETRAIVAEVYAEDIRVLGYDFHP